ncbi:MAG: heparinase II/III family protein [Bacilli bacterium]|nr:heparinase II/III family protein [Bacilli bacterium]MBN2696188.1 heparinase II/III family protein [Bacilli bacterium]
MKQFDVSQLKKRLMTNPDYVDMLHDMSDKVEDFFLTFEDGPENHSRWGHHYFCSTDGAPLSYDHKNRKLHVCPICQRNYTDQLYDDVWITLYRNQAVISLWMSALLSRLTRKKIYQDHIRLMIDTYVRQYDYYSLHNKENENFQSVSATKWGCGRIMPQGLNEAIFVMRMLTAFSIVKNLLTDEELASIHRLCENASELLISQINKIHNIPVWYCSALVVIGAFTDNTKLIDDAFNGKFGLYQQLKEGLSKDGLWYEGSIHYHFFLLEALMTALLFAQSSKFHPDKRFIMQVRKMLLMPRQYAFDNQVLPNPNDGWPDINLKTYLHVYDMASKYFGRYSDIGEFAAQIDASPVKRKGLPLSTPYYYDDRISLERLTWNPDFEQISYQKSVGSSTNLKSSQCVILKNDRINVFLKYGHNTPSHAHPDKMNIEVTIDGKMLTRELSNSGYGSTICNEWYRTSLAHSTVVVNGKNHVSLRQGKCIFFRKDYVKASTLDVYREETQSLNSLKRSMNNDEVIAYLSRIEHCTSEEAESMIVKSNIPTIQPGSITSDEPCVDFFRTIKLTENGFVDTFETSASEPVSLDYVFHSQAKLVDPPKKAKADPGFYANGYQYLQEFGKVIDRNKHILLKWDLEGVKLTSLITLYGKMKLYLMKTLDNPANETRDTFIIRCSSRDAKFIVRWKIEGKD